MWKLEINNQQVIFNGNIAMTEYSPIFYDMVSNSLPFNLADDDGGVNRRALGFLNKPEISDNAVKELPATIYAGIQILTGTVTAKWQNNAFSCYFKDTGSFWSAIKDKMLSDIAFDIIEFDQAKNHENMVSYIISRNDAENSNFVFPLINIGENAPIDMGVKMSFSSINDHFCDESNNQYIPWTPCLFLEYIYKQIFEKNGISIDEDVFKTNSDLKKLILPNNFLINEFDLSTVVITETNYLIGNISNTEEPTVTCIKAHNLINYQIVKINYTGSGMPISNRNFQIELIETEGVVDPFSFKLIGENLTTFTAFNNLHVASTDPVIVQYPPDWTEYDFLFSINGVQASAQHYITAQFDHYDDIVSANGHLIHIVSDDYQGYGYVIKINGDYGESLWIAIPGIVLSSKTFKNLKFIIIPSTIVKTLVGNTYHVTITNIEKSGVLHLMGNLISTVKEINPKNHVPYIKIYDFLKECFKTFGIVPFVSGNSVKIKLFKNILTDDKYTDISNYTTLIKDNENPAVAGYKFSFKDDSNDKFYGDQVKIHKIESKYTVCESVQTKVDLPVIGSNTNDVRLVIRENSWYAFNKSFLNTDNNWKLLSYNILDAITVGEGLVKESQFSPVLSVLTGSNNNKYFLPKMDVPFACKNFPTDKQMAARLLYYQGLKYFEADPFGYSIYYSSGDIYPFNGHESPVAHLSIRWDTDYGIINNFLKEELYWQLNIRKDCIYLVYWPNKLSYNFDYSKKYRNKGIDHLVKSRKYSFNFKNKTIEVNDTELAKV